MSIRGEKQGKIIKAQLSGIDKTDYTSYGSGRGLVIYLMLLLREQLAREVEYVLRRGGRVVAPADSAAARGHVGEGSQLRHGRSRRHRPVVCNRSD